MQQSRPEMHQIDAMRMGVDYVFQVEVRSFKLNVRPLSIVEINAVYGGVGTELAGLPEAARTPLRMHSLLAMAYLERASTTSPDINDPQISKMVLERCTSDEISALYAQYNRGCERVNPSLETLSEDEIQALVVEVKKNDPGPDQVSALTELSFMQLVSMASLALRTPGD